MFSCVSVYQHPLVETKKRTDAEPAAVKQCSDAIFRARENDISRTKFELEDMKSQSKLLWNKSVTLLGDEGKACSIPALKNDDGEWVKTTEGKSNVIAKTLSENTF